MTKKIIKIFGRKKYKFWSKKSLKNGIISGYGFFGSPKPRAKSRPMILSVKKLQRNSTNYS